MSNLDFLEVLSNHNGVSGFEYTLNEKIISYFEEYADEVSLDRLGNITILKKGSLLKAALGLCWLPIWTR